MSAVDSKKSKRRKNKPAVVKSNISSSNGPVSNDILLGSEHETEGCDEAEHIEKMMDATDELDMPLPRFPRGPNPYFERGPCLLCGSGKELPDAGKVMEALDDKHINTDTSANTQLPLYVCPSCLKASSDSEMESKSGIDSSLLDPDLQLDSANLSFLPDLENSRFMNQNGTQCTCKACTERREIEEEHDRETQELQKCWADLRTYIRTVYGSEEPSLTDDRGLEIQGLVKRLCARDPHQLFLRMESQVREFVIEKKVRLLKQLDCGYKTPPEAKQFISLLLDEYHQLCLASRLTSKWLIDLKEHIKRFNVTWELHNKHLVQSIVYTDPAIHNSLHVIVDQLRMGAASKESYNEDTYPKLLHDFLKFQDEMSVILVVWRDCQQLIEAYNEQQTALKVKQKWLKEDWEFFKAQRNLLEEQVLKKQPKNSALSHSMEVQFTETMRNMLTGSKPSADECHCPRCNRKRCPCDECTITHMITCGIINPDALESNNTPQTFNFPHDPNRYVIDVTPPSMSSTTSSSGSSSPILVEHERLILPFDDCPEHFDGDDIPEEIDSQSDNDYDDDDDEDDEEGDEEHDKADMIDKDGVKSDELQKNIHQAWLGEKSDPCDCHHCIPEQPETMLKPEENQCQCHACMQQQGQTLPMTFPQHTVAPRPADLHLYPHIHGSPGLHGMPPRGIQSVLSPQLYDLHSPLRQSKLPVKLDFDNPDSIQDHLYHAYGDWDNTFDPRNLIGSHHHYSSSTMGSDLLPPPPPPLTNTMPYLADPLSCLSSQTVTCTTTTSAFKNNVGNHLVNSIPKSGDVSSASSQDQVHGDVCANLPKCSSPSQPTANLPRPHGPPCTRPVTLGGNTSSLSTGSDKLQQQQQLQQRNHHCKKHNMPLMNKGQPGHNHAPSGSHAHQPDLLKNTPRNPGANKGEESLRSMGNANLNTNINPHPCSHAPPGNKNPSNHMYQNASVAMPHQGGCSNSVSMPTTVNNVSVGTSTVCNDPNCENHNEDNCDSIDDSCSEKSSSTSASNQKDGSKYCDCCYCEFFGHGNPPAAQTSKNYAEMRERLRRRLKRRQTEGKGCNEDGKDGMANDSDPLEMKGLEELLRFINGTDMGQGEEKPSAKASKRARRKQRLADQKAEGERAKLLKEIAQHEKSLAQKICADKQRSASDISSDKQPSVSSRKKKSKHKELKTTSCQEKIEESLPKLQNGPLSNHSTSPAKSDIITINRMQQTAPSPKHSKSSNNNLPPTGDTKKDPPGPRSQAHTASSTPAPASAPAVTQKGKVSQRTLPQNGQGDVSLTKKANSVDLKYLENQQKNSSNNLKNNFFSSVIPIQSVKPVPVPAGKVAEVVSAAKKGKKQAQATQQLPQSQPVRQQNGTAHLPANAQPSQSPAKSVVIGQQQQQQQQQQHQHQQQNQQQHHQQQQHKQLVNSEPKERKLVANGTIPTANGDIARGPGKNNKMIVKPKQDCPESRTSQEQMKNVKSKKGKKKNKTGEESRCVDEIFMPRSESDLEDGNMDEVERELEEFKRFCFDSPKPKKKEKLQVNFNLKDIFAKKKSGMGCS
ncbi:protein FAM193A-like [Gigantopelta aegis]|uniref:protein FAM193A-like n=1 Tax=Gigantopelta aegis TaxID=1735272 RepID=UPI001B88DC1A|nr:protein FAM193A-like [Gigantopelta aegis]